MEKINVAELLKDCPRDMELDCTMYDNCTFAGIEDVGLGYVDILVKTPSGIIRLTKEGCYHSYDYAKCVIFPKGKTTWEGFQRPFKDGDIAVSDKGDIHLLRTENSSYCAYRERWRGLSQFDETATTSIRVERLATEEEKQILFDAIKENGYRWNEETKTLEMLNEPKFKIEKGKWYVCIKDLLDNYANKAFRKGDTYLSTQDGSLIPSNSNVPFEIVCPGTYFRDWTIQDAKEGDVLAAHECLVLFKKLDGLNIKCYCTYHFMDYPGARFYTNTLQNKVAFYPATKDEKQELFWAIKDNGYKWNPDNKTLEKVEPKFKVGNKVRVKNGVSEPRIIDGVFDTFYSLQMFGKIDFTDQDRWELVHDKFDLNTLVPFESRVLVRNNKDQYWIPAFWGGKRTDGYTTTFGWSKYCIPFDGNKHLLNSNKECDKFYRTWEKIGD